MMFVDYNFFNNENAQRISFGMVGALAVHMLILLWFSMPQSQKIISANTFSPPTNVSVHFITPSEKPVIQKKPKPIVEKVKAEPARKKPVMQKTAKAVITEPTPNKLNQIEPAAAPQTYEPTPQSTQQKPLDVLKPLPDVIPVISEASVKGRRAQPEYPKRALRMRQEGVVWLHVLIDEEGSRQDIKLHKPSQYALLNQAALKAVKKWTFDPNLLNGQAVQSWVEIPIEFKIR